ncbi:hypothetical protein [Segatella maculosa]|uniref:hypothetical protein n=1 Tax=Segatella maculosa TaxID=439703 RepID=UPI00037BFD85|nr:hypothetical protein [Segatella maculosa]
MKANMFLVTISIALSALIGYLAFNVAEGKEHSEVCGWGSTICFVVTLIPMIGLHYDSGRLGVNVRVCSALFFIMFLISHFCFAGFGINIPYYIVINGILLTIYFAIFYKMQGIKHL